jgi:hypothetical protein
VLIGQYYSGNQFDEVVIVLTLVSILPGVSNTPLSSSTRQFDSWLVSHGYRAANGTDSVPLRWQHKCCPGQVLQSTQQSIWSKAELHRVPHSLLGRDEQDVL